jgi:hypothetical protein
MPKIQIFCIFTFMYIVNPGEIDEQRHQLKTLEYRYNLTS